MLKQQSGWRCYFPYHLLQIAQRITNHADTNKLKQLHSLLTTNGYFLITSQWINTLLYTTLIRAYLNIDQPHTTLILFRHMLLHRAPPNNLIFPSIIKAAASFSPPRFAALVGIPVHGQTIRRGVLVDPFVATSFVSFYGDVGDAVSARKVFDEMIDPCVVSCNAMIDAFGRNGDLVSADLLFSGMSRRDVFSWTSVIAGYTKNGCSREAIGFFEKMMGDDDVIGGLVKPNEATFVSVLHACGNVDDSGALYLGKQVHGYMVRNEPKLSDFMGTALISFYGKMGCFKYAFKVFNMVVVKVICIWNAMITSLALNGREKDALDMFMAMRRNGLQPNEVTFVSILTACARAKLVDLGLEFFQSMQPSFGVAPKMEHYGCVVDLLGRAGLLREASDFIEKMPFEADASVLGALLGACRMHSDAELADEVGQRLLKLQPGHCGRYVVLSSIYAEAERWEYAASVRKYMTGAGIDKVPAYSVIHR